MEYIRNQVEFLRTHATTLYEIFLPEEIFFDAVDRPIGYDEYFGTSRETPRVDPQNWDLYWVSQADESPPQPELQDSPKEDQPEGVPEALRRKTSIKLVPVVREEPELKKEESESEEDEPEPKKDEPEPKDATPEAAPEAIAKDEPEAAAEDRRNSKKTSIFEAVAEPPPRKPPSFLGKVWTFVTTRLPSVKLPEVKPEPVDRSVTSKKPEPLHYSRTPLATYARVKSRLQDRPPLVAAFADQVSALNPAALVPKAAPDPDKPTAHSLNTWGRLMQNLGYVLPTPLADLVHTRKAPRKRSLASILGARTARKVVAEVELDPLDDSMIPQYRKWKRIKNKRIHNAQWACLITMCILLICAVHIKRLREIKWWKFEFWQWLALGFVALGGRLISGWAIKLLEISIEFNLFLKKRILYFIFGVRRSMKNIMWLGLILITWTVVVLHVEDVSDTIPTITKLLQCAFTGAMLWLLKVLLVKILTDSFHRAAYFDRIQDSLFHQYVLEILSEPRSHRYARSSAGKGPEGRRRHAPVFKLRQAPSQKVARREVKTQGRIERQYSPTPSTYSVEKLELRTSPKATYSKTTLNPSEGKDSWINFRIRSLWSPANILSPTIPPSPKVLRTGMTPLDAAEAAAEAALMSSGAPSPLRGGSNPSDPLETQPSLTIASPVDSQSRSKVTFQDIVSEEPNFNQEVVDVEKFVDAVEAVEVEEFVDAVEDMEAVEVVKVVEAVEAVQASLPVADVTVPGVEVLEEVVIPEPEITSQDQEVIQLGLSLQDLSLQEKVILQEFRAEIGVPKKEEVQAEEVIQPGLSLQENVNLQGFQVETGVPKKEEFQAEEVIQPGLTSQEKVIIQALRAEMEVPKKEEVQAETVSAPEPQVVATNAVPEPMLSAGPSEPVAAPKEPESKPPPIFVAPEIELEDETGHHDHTMIAQDKIQILTKDSVSAWTLMRLMKVVRTRNLHMYSKSSLVEPDWEIDSIPMATKAAKYIFKNVANKGQQELLLKNFMRFFPPDKATQLFTSFEVTLNGTITKQGLLKWVLDVYKERKSLSLTLNDNRSVIFQINLLLDGVLIAVILAISFLIMSVNNQALLAITTMLLAPGVSIFGNLFRNTFESVLFLFIVHPFDVGDRVFIEGVPLMVEEMKIMSTVFLNNSSEHITYPNFVLINKPIANIHRSPDQWDAIEFQILANTSLEKLSTLRNRIDKYVQALPQIWYPRWRLIVRDIENTNKLRLLMTIQHHINFQDAGERTQRRGDMLLHIQGLMLDLAIGYQLPPGQAHASKTRADF